MNNVVVIGGGVVGLAAMLAMHQRGYSTTLIDSGVLSVDSVSVSPRVYAINHASQRLLQQIDVWDNLDQQRISPYQHMHVWDAVNHAHIDFDARMIASERLGSIIDESNLKQALLQDIVKHNISLIAESTVTSVNVLPDRVEIQAGQHCIVAGFVIIADGALSPVRQLLGVPVVTWPYHQHALVATVQTEKSHQHTAYQVFNTDGVLAFLPLADKHRCSIVWSSAPHLTQQRMALAGDEFNQQLTAAFEAKLGEVTLMTKRHQFPLHMRHVKHYVGTRWMLMGDAAHTIHPLAGLGLNLGLADLTTWLALLDEKQANLCSKKMLGAYQRQRKHAVWQAIALMEGIKATFLNPLLPMATLRGLGLNICNQLTPMKRLFIQHATGIYTH